MDKVTSSRDVAKQRLRQVLVQDRARLSPETMAALKQAILTAAKEYIVVDPDNVHMQLELGSEIATLNIRMHVTSIVREREP